jgi:hypothetical protein
VVVPPLLTMRRTTLALLKKLKEAGGTVVFAGDVCRCLDGLRSDEVVEFARACVKAPAKGKRMVRAVEASCRRVSVKGADGREIVSALHLLKEDGDAFYLFVCNVGHDFVRGKLGRVGDIPVRERRDSFPDVRIRGFAECKGMPVELDPDTGDVVGADAERRKEGWEIRTSLPVLGSRLFAIPKRKRKAKRARGRALKEVRRRRLVKEIWKIALSECNNLVLDRPRYKIGAGPWQGPEEILRVDAKVRDELGVPRRGDRTVQPWARVRGSNPRRVRVELAYDFVVKVVPPGELCVAMEHPEGFGMAVNGVPVSAENDVGWWTDRSLRRISFEPSLLRTGKNEIRLGCEYDEFHPGLESIYVLGEFGTEVRGTSSALTRMPTTLKIGDWVKQGLAFYSGSVSYMRRVRAKLEEGERLFLRIPGYEGVAVRVRVNGKAAGVIAWEPNEVDITDYVVGERLDLQIEVIGHRRNSHGPLHFAEKHPQQVTPDCYETKGKRWTDSYQLVACGLMEAPILVVRR